LAGVWGVVRVACGDINWHNNRRMRITRLHLLLVLVGLSGAGYGAYYWMNRMPAETTVSHLPKPPAIAPAHPASIPIVSHPKADPVEAAARREVATVGLQYDALRQKYGDLPSVAAPLRMAKLHLAQGRYELARGSAKQVAIAIKTLNQPHSGTAPETYQVVRGDTLWRIAQDHSPVHQGPGWVTIWKANKRTVKNFDRLEVGWNLKIPQSAQQYATPFWKPRMTATARLPLEVDVAELPAAVSNEVDVAELPMSAGLGEVDVAELPIAVDPSLEGFTISALRPEPLPLTYPNSRP
jgi:hypothetical protein